MWTCDPATIIDISTLLTSEWGLGSEALHLNPIEQELTFSIAANKFACLQHNYDTEATGKFSCTAVIDSKQNELICKN